jgi:hypothetical protein
MRTKARVRHLVWRIRDDREVGYSVLGDAVCDPHHTCGRDKERGFTGLALEPLATATHLCQIHVNQDVIISLKRIQMNFIQTSFQFKFLYEF